MINDKLFLETILMELRGKVISYSSYKAIEKILHTFSSLCT